MGRHGFFLKTNDEMPEKVKCHEPEKIDPMIEEDGKAGSAQGNKGRV